MTFIPKKPKGKRNPAHKLREPSPPGPHKKRAKVTTRYDECKAEWQRRQKDPDRGAGDWLVDKPDLSLDAAPFLKTLRRLGFVTQDNRYFDLHRDLMLSGMIDAKGKWSRYGTVLAHPDTKLLCEQIEQAIAADVPEREVLAEAVVAYNMKAASFDAAVKGLERLLHQAPQNRVTKTR